MRQRPDILLLDSTIQSIDHKGRTALAERFNIIYYDCESIQQLIERLQPGAAYSQIVAIVRNGWHKAGPYALHKPFATEVVKHYPDTMRIICCSGHGYDAADIEAITARGIWYCNTPDACTEAVANTGLSLVLDTFRYLTFAGWCARFDWFRNREIGLKAVDPCGKTLGVIGLGDIGLAIAKKCESALGMDIHYHGPRRKAAAEKQLLRGATYHADLDEMISMVDCVVVAAPYTRDTYHLLDRRRFNLAKKEGLRIVNIARGAMINEEHLVEALESGRVVGVGLDVHENEPSVNPALRDNWMVTVLPHIGVCSETSWEQFEKINLDNLEEYFRSGRPITPVNTVIQ